LDFEMTFSHPAFFWDAISWRKLELAQLAAE
jgi:hypothetical protein